MNTQLISQRVQNPLAPAKLNPQSGDAGLTQLSNIIVKFINITLIVAAVVFFFIFLIGGIKWIVAGGDKAQIESARKTLANAIIGLVIVFALFAILRLIDTLFGTNLLQIDLAKLKIV